MAERRAYVCDHSDHLKSTEATPGPIRIFLLPGEPAPPKCPKGHVMKRQPNVPYPAKGVAPTTN